MTYSYWDMTYQVLGKPCQQETCPRLTGPPPCAAWLGSCHARGVWWIGSCPHLRTRGCCVPLGGAASLWGLAA